MASYATALPAAWLQQSATTNAIPKDKIQDSERGNLTALEDITENDNNNSNNDIDYSLEMDDMSDFYYSDDEGDPTAKLEAVGIRTRDFAISPLPTPITTTDSTALTTGSRPPNQRNEPTLRGTFQPKPTAASIAGSDTSQAVRKVVEQNGRTSYYASELPQSWLQTAPSREDAAAAYQARFQNVAIRNRPAATQLRPPSLHRTDDSANDVRSRGSQGDVNPRKPGRSSYSHFENRQHLEFDPLPYYRNDRVTGNIPQPVVPAAASRPLSNTSLMSNYSNMGNSDHGSRHSSGDMPPRYPRYGHSDSTTST